MQDIDAKAITWTNCADEMPPNTKDKVIAIVGNIKTEEAFAIASSLVRSEYIRWRNIGNVPVYWTPYTPEKWKELTK